MKSLITLTNTKNERLHQCANAWHNFQIYSETDLVSSFHPDIQASGTFVQSGVGRYILVFECQHDPSNVHCTANFTRSIIM